MVLKKKNEENRLRIKELRTTRKHNSNFSYSYTIFGLRLVDEATINILKQQNEARTKTGRRRKTNFVTDNEGNQYYRTQEIGNIRFSEQKERRIFIVYNEEITENRIILFLFYLKVYK